MINVMNVRLIQATSKIPNAFLNREVFLPPELFFPILKFHFLNMLLGHS